MAEQLSRLQAALADRYTIERELGRGGMAIVYLAYDLKHNRPVAVKVLRPEVAAALGPERFLREIEIAARLNHPHILPLHDSGEANGFLYYVMPFVEGESLRHRLTQKQQLPIDEALQITREVGSALSYAHTHEVVHRDIKPENILLSDGVALVADFGIAQAVSSAPADQLTSTGVSVGTPAYMSPEQAAGQTPLDGRADQYSFACVLYEMLAGVPPFAGPNQQAVLARHAIDPVPPLRTVRSTTPEPVERAVLRALAKSPADRFPTVGAFQEALTRTVAAPTSRRRVARIGLLAAGAMAVAAGVYGLLIRHPPPRRPGSDTLSRSIAVLPFANIGDDTGNVYFGDGMAEELITSLSKVTGLSVLGRNSSFRFRGGDAQDIGKQLAVGYVIEGGVRKAGHRLRVSIRLIDATNGHLVWSNEYERDDQDVFAVQDELSQAIVDTLQAHLPAVAGAPSATGRTGDPEAYDLYLRGRYFYEKRDSASLRKAEGYFRQAIRKDSTYALAYSGLSDTYSFLSIFGYIAPLNIFPQAKAAALRALALDNLLAEAHTSMATVSLFYDWDWRTAGREYERALAIDPRYAQAHLLYQNYFTAIGRPAEAVREAHRALELDPFHLIINTRLSDAYFFARRYSEALAQAQRTIDLDSTFLQAHYIAAHALLWLGRCDEAIGQIENRPVVRAAWLPGILGSAYGRCQHRAQALKALRQFDVEERQGRYVSHYPRAMIYAGLGDRERALAQLDSAYEERASAMIYLQVAPEFDALRADPRFTRLLKKAGLTS